MIESVAWEENLADPSVIVEEAFAALCDEPPVEPISRVLGSRTDAVFLGNQENVPYCVGRDVVA